MSRELYEQNTKNNFSKMALQRYDCCQRHEDA